MDSFIGPVVTYRPASNLSPSLLPSPSPLPSTRGSLSAAPFTYHKPGQQSETSHHKQLTPACCWVARLGQLGVVVWEISFRSVSLPNVSGPGDPSIHPLSSIQGDTYAQYGEDKGVIIFRNLRSSPPPRGHQLAATHRQSFPTSKLESKFVSTICRWKGAGVCSADLTRYTCV